MSAMWNGKNVTEREYWKLRLEKIIEGGCKLEDLQDLKVDLEMTDLTGEETYKVPSVILEVPLYQYDENDDIIEYNSSEVEDEIEELLSVTEVCGYVVYASRESISYIPKN